MKHYPYIIKGGTALGAGIAAALAEAGIPSLVFDGGSLPGGEFAAAFAGEAMMAYTPVSAIARAFQEELVQREVISQRGDNYPALEPVFCSLLNRYHGTVDFLARACAISEVWQDGVLHLELHTIGGVFGFTGERLIDTTTAGRDVTRNLAAAVQAKEAVDCDSFAMIPGCHPEEYFIRMSAEGLSYVEARAALLEAWRNRPETLRAASLLYIADRFAESCAPGLVQLGEGHFAIPSVGYGSALEALDAGARLLITNPEVTV